MNVGRCKWVFRVKYNSDRTIQWDKARLVAKGFQQTPKVHYFETFNLVVRFATNRIILSVVVSYNWKIRQMDAINAFLNGGLDETVYISQPKGFSIQNGTEKYVCHFNKALNGLK